ncbi:MAG: glycosyltransferase family 2 protein [Armatimonadetes bacterium]|nr:glycosyltransferase family 2 protein [Armatimonadota bacterium]
MSERSDPVTAPIVAPLLAAAAVDLSLIVLNWNTQADLERCLVSIEGQDCGVSVETVVVDNASEDGSVEMVRAQFPNVRLVVNEGNLGFGAGNNRGISHTYGRYVMFLNSDTVMTHGALGELVRHADRRLDAAIFGPKLLNTDGSLQYSCRSFPNLGTGFFRNTPLGRLFPRNRFTDDYLLSSWDHSSARDVDWVSGSALMIRREDLLELGGFDEGFFMYCEDVDLCYRARLLGRKVVYCPASVIYHHIGRSSDQVPTRMTFEFHRSMYRFYRKHYRRSTPWHIRPLILPGLAARAVGKLVRYRLYSLGKQWAARRRGTT